jgi:hypothetical protein
MKMAMKTAKQMVREPASRPDEDGCNIDHAYGIDDQSCKFGSCSLSPRVEITEAEWVNWAFTLEHC